MASRNPSGSPAATYDADTFAIDCPEGWSDATLHVIEGPTVEGHPHAITIRAFPDPDADTVEAFAEALVETVRHTLREAALLVFDTIPLGEPPAASGRSHGRPGRRPGRGRGRSRYDARSQAGAGALTARRAIFRWHPEGSDEALYQEQLFVLSEDGSTGHVLTASFTDASRRAAGDRVERVMRSFRPVDK